MRRALLLAVLVAAAVTACGASAARSAPIVFGITGGNMVPYRVSIAPTGSVRVKGSARVKHGHIAVSTVRRLHREIANAHLASRRCPGVLPDVGSQFITAGSRTWTVHGSCEKRFGRVWNDLATAVGLRVG